MVRSWSVHSLAKCEQFSDDISPFCVQLIMDPCEHAMPSFNASSKDQSGSHSPACNAYFKIVENLTLKGL